MKNNYLKIACFHGVMPDNQKIEGIQNYQKKHISKTQFDNYLKDLKEKKKVNFIKIDELLKKNFVIKSNSYLITFDDGYKNNFTIANKILNKYKIPATFFICPDMINSNDIFWSDKVEHIVNFTEFLKVEIDGKKILLKNKSKKNKIKNLLYLKKRCKNISSIKRQKFMDFISKHNFVKNKYPSFYKTATWKEVKKAKNELLSIGNHFINHKELTNLSRENLIQVLSQSKKIFNKQKLNKSFYFASYPEGKYNSKVIKIIKSKGIRICPTVGDGLNKGKLNLFTLSRYMVGFNKNKMYF